MIKLEYVIERKVSDENGFQQFKMGKFVEFEKIRIVFEKRAINDVVSIQFSFTIAI